MINIRRANERSSVSVNGQSLHTSDAVAVSDERELLLQPDDHAELTLFDLA